LHHVEAMTTRVMLAAIRLFSLLVLAPAAGVHRPHWREAEARSLIRAGRQLQERGDARGLRAIIQDELRRGQRYESRSMLSRHHQRARRRHQQIPPPEGTIEGALANVQEMWSDAAESKSEAEVQCALYRDHQTAKVDSVQDLIRQLSAQVAQLEDGEPAGAGAAAADAGVNLVMGKEDLRARQAKERKQKQDNCEEEAQRLEEQLKSAERHIEVVQDLLRRTDCRSPNENVLARCNKLKGMLEGLEQQVYGRKTGLDTQLSEHRQACAAMRTEAEESIDTFKEDISDRARSAPADLTLERAQAQLALKQEELRQIKSSLEVMMNRCAMRIQGFGKDLEHLGGMKEQLEILHSPL